MSNILVIGSSGKVGSYLCGILKAGGFDVSGWRRSDCDLEDGVLLERMIARHPARCVVNCVAVSGIEACVDDPVRAHLVNAVAPQLMARACAREGKRLIHLSTDYVLDGRRPGLKGESGKRSPVNVYGASKEEGEWRVLDECPSSLVARVSWVFGHPSKPSFAESVLERAMTGGALSAVADKDSLPTWIDDLCHWLSRLASDDSMPSGIMHLCQSGNPVTWYDYAREIVAAAREKGIPLKNDHIDQQKLDEQPGFRDARPRHTAMDNARLVSYLGRPVRSWQEAVRCWLNGRFPDSPSISSPS